MGGIDFRGLAPHNGAVDPSHCPLFGRFHSRPYRCRIRFESTHAFIEDYLQPRFLVARKPCNLSNTVWRVFGKSVLGIKSVLVGEYHLLNANSLPDDRVRTSTRLSPINLYACSTNTNNRDLGRRVVLHSCKGNIGCS